MSVRGFEVREAMCVARRLRDGAVLVGGSLLALASLGVVGAVLVLVATVVQP